LKKLLNILLLFTCVSSFAQISHIEFIENKGQWNDNVVFKAHLPGGNLYLEDDAITYQFYDEQDMARFHDLHHHAIQDPKPQDYFMSFHAFKIKFLNAQTDKISATEPVSDYVNYFLGNDKSKWASNVKKYRKTTYNNIYFNTDLKFYLEENYLKYDFVVHQGGNPAQIQMDYEGVDNIVLNNGELKITTSVNEMIEQKPYAYQMINGNQKEVKCKFKLDGNIVSFDFPKGYNRKYDLIIDPILVFASYSGSTVDNWGYTSTFDDAGHLYGGGVTFGIGYPVTTGAYQINFAGGTSGVYDCDITISKFSPDGTALIYATYLGGNDNESPHSLIVNNAGELLIFGTTSSADYPVSLTAYDTSFNGGISYTGSVPYYTNGSDMFVSKLNVNGSTLLASTYVGGTGNDGLNISDTLKYNYADAYRGEIIIDANDNVYVASTTLSNDFPVSTGAFQATSSGNQDGCIFKMPSNLSSLVWSSYIGGTKDDAAYSLKINELGEIVLTGGTTSPDFPTTLGVLHSSFQLGESDAWISKINSLATSILASTFLGTSEYDQAYFIETDTANNVYVAGQTTGLYPIFPSTVYNNISSGQFLHKLSPDLSSTIFSTTFGTSSGEVDISLSAFLVNECNYIYVSGWGGGSNWAVPSSTTFGLPVTPNAVQLTTDGSDYYLAMFSEDAASLEFATFFGGNASNDHVDGGTSRFDKRGIVYQAVCSSCGTAFDDFPTTSGAFSTATNQNVNCNLGVFKLDLSHLTADAEAYTTPFYCIGDTVHFQNLSNGGISQTWNFGDGDTSTLFEPTHIYDTMGTYNVRLVVLDSVSCILRDTDYVDIFIAGPPVANISPVNGICKGDSIQLNITGGASYYWTPNYNILNNNTDTPTVWPDTTTIYTVITTDSCGMDTSQITVNVFQKSINIMADTMICLGQNVQIFASGGNSYLWSPAISLNNSNISNPIATPLVTTTYNVSITDFNNCIWDTLMEVEVTNAVPDLYNAHDVVVCLGDSIEVSVSGIGITTYSWSPGASLVSTIDSVTQAFPIQQTTYVIEGKNGCGSDYDTLIVNVTTIEANVVVDTAVCIGERVNLWASGGISYLWYSAQNSNLSIDSVYTPVIHLPTTFFVDITNAAGCTKTLSVFVDTLARPLLEIGVDIRTEWATLVELNPVTDGVKFWWSPSEGLSCDTCKNPEVTALTTSTFYLIVENANGCLTADTITIIFDGAIYVPNSFSPDGNGTNDVFYAYGIDIVEFEMNIYDRWGELLFNAKNMLNGWDGNYKGELAKNDVYVWKIKYKDTLGVNGILYGTVTLIK